MLGMEMPVSELSGGGEGGGGEGAEKQRGGCEGMRLVILLDAPRSIAVQAGCMSYRLESLSLRLWRRGVRAMGFAG